jgi:hypothetical protein
VVGSRHEPHIGIRPLLGFVNSHWWRSTSVRMMAMILIARCDRAHYPWKWRCPRSGWQQIREGRPGLSLGWDLPNILPLDLNLVLNSQFSTELSTYFIIDQYIEKLRHNSQLRTTRLNNYHALFYSEIDSYLIFWPLVSKNHRLCNRPMSTVVLWMLWVTSLWLVDLHILICSRLIIWSWIFSFHNISLISIMMCLTWTHDLLS